jgi:hypothetical protein
MGQFDSDWWMPRELFKQKIIDGVCITFTQKRVRHKDGSVSLKFSHDVRQITTKIPGKLDIPMEISLYGLLSDEV